jgi:hypothetical protein
MFKKPYGSCSVKIIKLPTVKRNRNEKLHCITLPDLRTGGAKYSYKIQIHLLQKQLLSLQMHYNEIHSNKSIVYGDIQQTLH